LEIDFHQVAQERGSAGKSVWRSQPDHNAEQECSKLCPDASDDGSLIRHERRIVERITDRQEPVELDEEDGSDDAGRRPPSI
jgi:hypothetical protein